MMMLKSAALAAGALVAAIALTSPASAVIGSDTCRDLASTFRLAAVALENERPAALPPMSISSLWSAAQGNATQLAALDKFAKAQTAYLKAQREYLDGVRPMLYALQDIAHEMEVCARE